jgi:hypothetical protein
MADGTMEQHQVQAVMQELLRARDAAQQRAIDLALENAELKRELATLRERQPPDSS